MSLPLLDRIDAAGVALLTSDVAAALREGEALHRDFRPNIAGDYLTYLERMANDGAGVFQLVHDGDVRAIAVWRTFLTTYCGRRFEIDDLVTSERHRSGGHGATLLKALETKARSLECDEVMLSSATHRQDAHRFYFRERYTIRAFLFTKPLD